MKWDHDVGVSQTVGHCAGSRIPESVGVGSVVVFHYIERDPVAGLVARSRLALVYGYWPQGPDEPPKLDVLSVMRHPVSRADHPEQIHEFNLHKRVPYSSSPSICDSMEPGTCWWN